MYSISREIPPPYMVRPDIEFLTTMSSSDDSFVIAAMRRNPFRTDRVYILAKNEEGKVVGAACLVESSMRQPGCVGIGYISVSPLHKNKGISKLLVRAVFEYALSLGKGVSNSQYEPEGLLYLKKVFSAVSADYPNVSFYER